MRGGGPRARSSAARTQAATPLASGRRPQRLLDRPEAIDVVYATPEGVPRRFMWRRAVHDIARVEGPERIAPEWWRQPSITRLRDYYRVEDAAGRRYWIYREGVIGDGRGGAAQLVHPRAVRLMPEKPGFSRLKLVRTRDMPPPPTTPSPYVELGVSLAILLPARSVGRDRVGADGAAAGMDAIGIADRNTLAGVVRMHSACTMRGSEAADRLPARPYRCAEPARLSDRSRRLWPAVAAAQPRQDAGGERRVRADALTTSRRTPRASPSSPGQRDDLDVFEASCRGLRDALTSLRHVAASWLYRGDDMRGSSGSTGWREANGCTLLATNDVHYHAPDRRPLQDVVTCIREKVTIANGRLSARRQCRAASEVAGRDGAAVRALAACDRGDARDRRRAALQPRRAALRISARAGARRPDAAGASGASDLGRRAAALSRRHSGQGR